MESMFRKCYEYIFGISNSQTKKIIPSSDKVGKVAKEKWFYFLSKLLKVNLKQITWKFS